MEVLNREVEKKSIRREFNYARLLPLLHIIEGGLVIYSINRSSINRSSIVININYR